MVLSKSRRLGALATAAVAFAGLAVLPQSALADCALDVTMTIATCTGAGTTADGVEVGTDFNTPGFGGLVDTVNVNSLTADIVPASGLYGVWAGSNSSITVNVDTGSYAIRTTGANAKGIYATTSGLDKTVTVNSKGSIVTEGQYADGINAVDNFGGGAVTVDNAASVTTTGNTASGIYVSTGTGTPITLTNSGKIVTSGYGSKGIVGSTYAGSVVLMNTGEVTTSGDNASAIAAATTVAGNPIKLTNSGALKTTGLTNSFGIVVSSHSSTTIDNSGSVTSVGYALYALMGGADAPLTVTNTGTFTSSGPTTIFISSADSTAIFNNSGTVNGGVQFSATADSAFNNLAGGLFNIGATNAIPTLNNAGTLAPGGVGTAMTSMLTGDVVQTTGGVFATDIAFGGTSDRLDITGTANLAGSLVPNILNPLELVPGQLPTVTVLTATNGITNSGISAMDLAILDYTLGFPDANTMTLSGVLNYAPAGLNANGLAVGGIFNAVQTAQTGELDSLVPGLFTLTAISQLQSAYDQLSPGASGMAQNAAVLAAQSMSDTLNSCHTNVAGSAIPGEGRCLWLLPDAAFVDYGARPSAVGFNDSETGISGGGQLALTDNIMIGAAFGYRRSDLSTTAGGKVGADFVNGGGVVKFVNGPFYVSGSVVGGTGGETLSRSVTFGGLSLKPTAKTNASYVGANARFAYAFDVGNSFYVKPFVDVSYVHAATDGYTETGGGAANLTVAGSSQDTYGATPMIEVGGAFAGPGGGTLRPHVGVGVTVSNGASNTQMASFVSAPSMAPFAVTSSLPKTLVDATAGLEYVGNAGLSGKVAYHGRFADDFSDNTVSLKLAKMF